MLYDLLTVLALIFTYGIIIEIKK